MSDKSETKSKPSTIGARLLYYTDVCVMALIFTFQSAIESLMAKFIRFGSVRIAFPNGKSLQHNAPEPHALYTSEHVTLIVHEPTRFMQRLLPDYKMGFCESYIESEIDIKPSIQSFVSMMLRNEQHAHKQRQHVNVLLNVIFMGLQWCGWLVNYIWHLLRSNTLVGSKRNIHEHYDVGNAFFELFLDDDMNYSCAYFKDPNDSLQTAQNNKLDMILDKLQVCRNSKVLEIGCGWGPLAVRGAEQRGLRWTGVTISEEQVAFGQKRVLDKKLADRVQLKLKDYRKTSGEYDAIASLEMLEHVGHEYLSGYFDVVADRLKPGGRAVLQAMVWPNATYDQYRKSSDFFKKHLAPGLNLPSLSAITAALPVGLEMKHMESTGTHYGRTMQKWIVKLEASKHRIIDDLGYSMRFYRLWHFFFCSCVPMFAEGYVDVAQMVFVKQQL